MAGGRQAPTATVQGASLTLSGRLLPRWTHKFGGRMVCGGQSISHTILLGIPQNFGGVRVTFDHNK